MRCGNYLIITWRNLEIKGPSPVAISVVEVKAKVLQKKVLLDRSAFVAGRRSLNLPLMCSSTGGSSPSLMALERLSLAPGISRGYPRSAMDVKRSNSPPKKYPSHQAPIQRGSSGVISTPGGCSRRKSN